MATFDDITIYSRRRFLSGLLMFVFIIFLGRLFQLQMIYQEEYGKKSEENSIRNIPTDPVRGYMIDRSGRLVVDNRPAFTVTVMPFEFDRSNTEKLATILSLDPSTLKERLDEGEAYSRFSPVKVKRDIDFRELSAIEENRARLPGVGYQIESKRFYPTAARAAHLLGYTREISRLQIESLGDYYRQGDVVGSSGIEQKYEQVLRGQKGAEFTLVNVRGQVTGKFEGGRHDVPPLEGDDVLLTMDLPLQALAESLMANYRGAIVAVDPANGGILAMVSKPDYDLSLLSGVTLPEIWQQLNTEESRPLFNRATLTRYPPGSTFKMVLAAAALERGIISPSTRINCTGAFRFGNKTFMDLHVHGSTDMVEAIQRSCNVYFYQLMMNVGLDVWSEYGASFGFGEPTGIDIMEESSGLLPTTEWMNRRYGARGWTRGFLPSLGIGQGELGVTPVQMARYAMALANRGVLYKLHAISAVRDKKTGTTIPVPSESRPVSFRNSTWDILREGMRRVVMEPGGTAGLARIKGVEAGGKTGTAENPHGKSHSWFVGFAPYEKPKIAIVVLVENVGYGGSYAAPIAGMCMEQYLFGRLIRFDRSIEVMHGKSDSADVVQQTRDPLNGPTLLALERSR
jgi:penicillin-binding protein 2